MADIEEPTWRDKHKIGALMKRLQDHANGSVDMTATQINAAKLYLSKTLPDLNRSELTGGNGKDLIPNKVQIELVDAPSNT